jgi:hypothetical protein
MAADATASKAKRREIEIAFMGISLNSTVRVREK